MAGKKTEKKGSSWFNRLKSRIFRTITLILVFAAGVFAGNLDRLDQRGLELLQYKEFIPKYLHVFLPGGMAKEGESKSSDELHGDVIEVYDGDTATLLSSDKTRKYKIRFFGIDAPEAAQEYGITSRNVLREKILGKKVRVVVASTDRYGRSVGKVYLDSRYINLEMVEEGHAWYYENYARNDLGFKQAQSKAQSNTIGIWQTPNPTPPWDYRRHQK